MPPRHGKSELASIKFPAWYLGRNPDKEIICCSATAEGAERFARRTRDLVEDELHGAVFPKCRLQKGSKSVTDWRVSARGGLRGTGIGGLITGMGANVLIIDDPLKDREQAESQLMRQKIWDWYTSTAFTRLEKDGAVILIMTRWHDDDLAGRLLQLEGRRGEYWSKEKEKWIPTHANMPLNVKRGAWDVVIFPAEALEQEEYRMKGEALWPAKYNMEALMEIKATVGIRDWSALYQQNPVLEEGSEFKTEWFKNWKDLPGKMRKITTVDLAISQKAGADDSVVMTCGVGVDSKIYVLEYKNWKATPSEVIDEIYRQSTLHGSQVVVETTGYQQALMHYIEIEGRKRKKYLHVYGVKHYSRKEERIRGLIPFYSNGLVYHKMNESEVLEDQLTRFPSGKHDDVIDALSMAIPYLKSPHKTDASWKDPTWNPGEKWLGREMGKTTGNNVSYALDGSLILV